MQTYFDCLPCFVRQALASARMVTDDAAVHEHVMRSVLATLAEIDMRVSPPAMAGQLYRTIREASGSDDPYREVKRASNALAMRLLPDLRARVRSSPDPLATAIRLAIAGNVIDFGVRSNITDEHILEAIDWSLDSPLPAETLAALRASIDSAASILYLADNAGEIVLDRLLLELLPTDLVLLVVRGTPVINDATLEDARAAGVTELVKVIDNGSDAPGTVLEACSDALRRSFAEADLVIAKGQGNYESLNGEEREIYYLFKAKCPVAARSVGCEVGDLVFARGVGRKLA